MAMVSEVRDLLGRFCAAFNQRDLPAFMALYSQRPQVVYVFGGTVLIGREAIERDYREKFFASPAGSDRLTLDLLDLVVLNEENAIATGQAKIFDGVSGRETFQAVTTLVIVREAGNWRVLYDHTS